LWVTPPGVLERTASSIEAMPKPTRVFHFRVKCLEVKNLLQMSRVSAAHCVLDPSCNLL